MNIVYINNGTCRRQKSGGGLCKAVTLNCNWSNPNEVARILQCTERGRERERV